MKIIIAIETFSSQSDHILFQVNKNQSGCVKGVQDN